MLSTGGDAESHHDADFIDISVGMAKLINNSLIGGVYRSKSRGRAVNSAVDK